MNQLSREWAEVICELEDVCMNEGIGPEVEKLQEIFDYINEHYPEVIKLYWWSKYFPTKGKS